MPALHEKETHPAPAPLRSRYLDFRDSIVSLESFSFVQKHSAFLLHNKVNFVDAAVSELKDDAMWFDILRSEFLNQLLVPCRFELV